MAKPIHVLAASLLFHAWSGAAIPDAPHPDYALSPLLMPAYYKTMGIAFMKDGTMVLATTAVIGGGEVPVADAKSKVYLVKGASTDALPAEVKEIANTWKQPSGVTVAADRVFVSDRDGFYEIPDLKTPTDPAANRRLVVAWPNENHWNNGPFWHQWAFTPQYRNGAFYAPYSGSIGPGGWSNVDPTSKLSGALLKWDLDGNLEAYAGGLRSPNGAAFDSSTGELFATDNQGSWLPSSTFLRIRKGRFYGHRQSSPDVDSLGVEIGRHAPNFAEELPYDPPVAWLPHGTVRSSPSQPAQLRKGVFAGDWIIGDVNGRGLVRVYVDRVGEECNGALFWFSQGTGISSVNRMAEAPDGGIVIGTITRIGGNWPSGDDAPMYKLTAKAQATAFDMKAVRSVKDGLEVEFTRAVNPDSIGPAHFSLRTARYIRQKEYGAGKQPDEIRNAAATEVSADRRRVHLRIDGLQADRVIYIRAEGVASAGGDALWNDEAWFTLNAPSAREWQSGIPASPIRARDGLPGAWVPRLRAARDGSLEVTVGCSGTAGCGGAPAFDARLLAPDGKAPAGWLSSSGGPIRLARPGANPGLFLLQVRRRGGTGNDAVTRRVFF
jgi:hypothetical protein